MATSLEKLQKELEKEHSYFRDHDINFLKFRLSTFTWVCQQFNIDLNHEWSFNSKTNKFSAADSTYFRKLYRAAYWATILHSIDNMNTRTVLGSKRFKVNAYIIWKNMYADLFDAEYKSWIKNFFRADLCILCKSDEWKWARGWNAGFYQYFDLKKHERKKISYSEAGYLTFSEKLLAIIKNPDSEFIELKPIIGGNKRTETISNEKKELRKTQMLQYKEIVEKCQKLYPSCENLEFPIKKYTSEDYSKSSELLKQVNNFIQYNVWKQSEHSYNGLINNTETLPKYLNYCTDVFIFLSQRINQVVIEKICPYKKQIEALSNYCDCSKNLVLEFLEQNNLLKRLYSEYKSKEWGKYHKKITKTKERTRKLKWKVKESLNSYDERYHHYGPADKIYAKYENAVKKLSEEYHSKTINYEYIEKMIDTVYKGVNEFYELEEEKNKENEVLQASVCI